MTHNILIVPGYHGSGDTHWQTWLEAEIPDTVRVSGIDWEKPILHNWAGEIIRTLDESADTSIIVAHSFGCLASAFAVVNRPHKVAGVLLVAPASPERFSLLGVCKSTLSASHGIARYLPEGALNVPGLVIGSRNDPWMKLEHAYAWSKRWKLGFYDAGEAGHINVDSGFGPWPLIKAIVQSLTVKTKRFDAIAAHLPDVHDGLAVHAGPIFPKQFLLYR